MSKALCLIALPLLACLSAILAPPLGFMVDGCTEYNRTDGSTQIIYYRVIGDVPNNTKILLFYVSFIKNIRWILLSPSLLNIKIGLHRLKTQFTSTISSKVILLRCYLGT